MSVENAKQQLVVNTVDLISDLPPTSPHRRPILSTLSTNIPTSIAADLFNVSPSAIKNSRHPDYNPHNTELYSKYKHGVKRKRISYETTTLVQEYIKSRCPVKSGSVRVLYKQYITDGQLYKEYCEDFGDCAQEMKNKLGGDIVVDKLSYKTFMQKKGDMRVSKQKTYWGQFDCPICLKKKICPSISYSTNINDSNTIQYGSH